MKIIHRDTHLSYENYSPQCSFRCENHSQIIICLKGSFTNKYAYIRITHEHFDSTLSFFCFQLPLLPSGPLDQPFNSQNSLSMDYQNGSNTCPFFFQPLVLFMVTFHITKSFPCFTCVTLSLYRTM